jgi:polyadenylate-binding protein
MLLQMIARGGGGRGYRYPSGRGMPDPAMHGVGGVMPSPYEMGGMPMRDTAVSQPIPIGALATALANAPPDQQRMVCGLLNLIIFYYIVFSGRCVLWTLMMCCLLLQMLGENLYPLVDQLEHDQAAKVTGMLLEMDQTEVLHLLESPDALKAKVAEAMEVLRSAQHNTNQSPEQQLASLSLNDGLISS